jgi:hypothetical protein
MFAHHCRHASTLYVAFETTVYVRYAVPWIEASCSPGARPSKIFVKPDVRFPRRPTLRVETDGPRLVTESPATSLTVVLALVRDPSRAVTVVGGTSELGAASGEGLAFWST